VKVLTDTHSLVWALADPDQLSTEARNVLSQAEVTASAANLWELILKKYKKDALVADPLSWWERYVTATGIPALGIRVNHVKALSHLPDLHKDPFDRILIAQSIVEKLPLVSKDRRLAHYGISLIW
jgi:PIN domain nuclease of toxin-antitoxin system